MAFTNSTTGNDIKLNLNQSTLDFLNAAIASHSNTQLQQVQEQLLLSSGIQLGDDKNSISQQQQQPHGISKRSIDSTDENDIPEAATPKRPGRKPLEKTSTVDQPLDPKQKRKAQNRAAQRAFRERKEKHVSELQARIKELEELTSKTDKDLIEENNQLKEQLKKLQEENYALKDAKFTFEFPLSDQQQQQQNNNKTRTTTTSSPTSNVQNNTNDIQDDASGGSSSSGTEQSPLSLAQEDDSDTPATKTPTSFQDASNAFLPFGSIAASQDFDFLAVPGGKDTSTSPSYDLKELFHGKNDIFTGYRQPSTSDEFGTDDFLLDNSGLPALFGGDDLFGFTQQQAQHAPFLLDQFYMPHDVEPRPHIRKETLEASLQRAKQEGVRAYEVQEQLKNCPDFNLDALCEDLKAKASCCESKYVLTEHDVESYLQCFDQKL
ncbi:uncharacterized protein BX664DRAFT_321433 [Halteromyces radiatus]|uniref:uncharacterized protein n=1 Tax=Halteromyces radiatus TaxID=101107 RepID=UPI002220687E|nr:uncharacterized protein BX664DRAFT_321433 [Halteromyces radiatus]KAI8099498.1 hypothetical protein BX664DRAFT_321433 [Halteromyces radiatus]